MDTPLFTDRFPRSNQYNPDWVTAGASGGANPLWLTEWLTSSLELRPGMRVLDLGCGRAMSSIFLRREFGVQVWAADLWFSPSENWLRIRDAGYENEVFPISAEARSLPFANDFFDAILSIDSFPYYGTDELYLSYLARFVKPGGPIAIAGAGLMHEIEGETPIALKDWWEPGMSCFHSADWWRSHWQRSGIVDVEKSDSMVDGWQFWLQWQQVIAPDNRVELQAIEADSGNFMGYVRTIGRRRAGLNLDDPITSVPTVYSPHPVTRPAA